MFVRCPQCQSETNVAMPAGDTISCTSCGFQWSSRDLSFVVAPDEAQADTKTVFLGGPGESPSLGKPAQPTGPAAPKRLDHYELISFLAQGGFGEVHVGRDLKLDRPIAIKIPRADRFKSGSDYSRYLRTFFAEGRRAARLEHPGIVRVYDVGHDRLSDTPYLVMELVEGETLEEKIHREKRMEPRVAAELIVRVADAVHFAHHADLVHRDLKPSNILIDKQGNPRLTDFGLAITEAEQIELNRDCSGTLVYMPPEQMLGNVPHLDARADLWSLGVILYRCLSGRLPFLGKTDAETRDAIEHKPVKPLRQLLEIPRELDEIVQKCLEKQPERRFATVGDLRDALADFLTKLAPAPTSSEQTTAPSVAPLNAAPTRSKLRSSLLTLLGILSVVLAVAIAYGASGYWKKGSQHPLLPALDERVKLGVPYDLLRTLTHFAWFPHQVDTRTMPGVQDGILTLDSKGLVFLQTETTKAASFRLSVELDKSSWQDGFAGIWLGGVEVAQPDGSTTMTLQMVGIDCTSPDKPRLVRHHYVYTRAQPNQPWESQRMSRIGSENIESPDLKSHRLEVTVVGGQIIEVRWRDDPYDGLIDRNRPPGAAGLGYRGPFGTFNSSGSTKFQDLRFTLLR